MKGFRSGRKDHTVRLEVYILGCMSMNSPRHIPTSEGRLPCTAFPGIPPIALETARLTLRAIQSGDGQLLFDLYANDVDTCKYLAFKVTGEVADSEAFCQSVGRSFDGIERVPTFAWLIQRKDTLEYIGSCGYGPSEKFSKEARCVEGGYVLNKKFWGNGYASEVWGELVRTAQRDPTIQRIAARHHPDNVASGKVMLAAGMKFEAIIRDSAVFPNIGDTPCDEYLYVWDR